MITSIFAILTSFIVHSISALGYAGVAGLMAIESAAIPLPSEIIMPFAGYLVSAGRFTLFGIALAGAIGSVIGSLITYYIGLYGGRPLIQRYGKYVLISHHDLDITDRFFQRYGSFATFMGRILPVFRTFISIPAGIARVPIGKFIFYTFTGSFIWSWILGYAGMKLGPAWVTLRERIHWLDYVIIVAIIIFVVWWVWRHLQQRSQTS